eukprot:2079909-Prymnesium_polylepis.3
MLSTGWCGVVRGSVRGTVSVPSSARETPRGAHAVATNEAKVAGGWPAIGGDEDARALSGRADRALLSVERVSSPLGFLNLSPLRHRNEMRAHRYCLKRHAQSLTTPRIGFQTFDTDKPI